MTDLALAEAPGMPPDWVTDPSADPDLHAEQPRSAAISVRFFRAPDPRTNELDLPIIDASGNIPVIELVEITNRNDPKNSPMIQIATNVHRYKKYPREYARYKQGLDMQAGGTPLSEWLGDNDRTRHLAMWHVHTVEQLAALADEPLQSFGPGTYELRQRAQAYLASRKDTGIVEKLAAENAEMKSQLAQLTAMMKSGQVQIEQPTEETETEQPVRRKPGRPPRNQEN